MIPGARNTVLPEEAAVEPVIPLLRAPHNAAVGVALDGTVAVDLGELLGMSGALDEALGVINHDGFVDRELHVAQELYEMSKILLDVRGKRRRMAPFLRTVADSTVVHVGLDRIPLNAASAPYFCEQLFMIAFRPRVSP